MYFLVSTKFQRKFCSVLKHLGIDMLDFTMFGVMKNVSSIELNCSYTQMFQVRSDYLWNIGDKVDQDVAIRLACIEIRLVSI